MAKRNRIISMLTLAVMLVASLSVVIGITAQAAPDIASKPIETVHDWEITPKFDETGAKDLWVATTGTDASGFGTEAAPYKTIQYAVDRLKNGGTIWVAPGTYTNGWFYMNTSAAPDAWRRVAAQDPANRPVINIDASANIPYNGTQQGSVISFTGGKYWVVDGFVVEGGNKGGTMSQSQLATYVGGGSDGYDELAGRKVGRYGIYANSADWIVVRNNSVDGVVVTGIFAAQTPHAVFEYNWSQNNGEHGYYYNNSTNFFRYTGNVSRRNTGCGFHLNGDVDSVFVYADREKDEVKPLGVHCYGKYEYNAAIHNSEGWFRPGGGADYNLSSLRYGIVRGNYGYAGGSTGAVTCYIGNSADTARYCEFYNNTFISGSRFVLNLSQGGVEHSCGVGAHPHPGNGHDDYPGATATVFPNDMKDQPIGHKFYNNILGRLDASASMVQTDGEGGKLLANHGMVIENNIFITSASRLSGATSAASESPEVSSAFNAMLNEKNTIVKHGEASTVLVDMANGDFRLVNSASNPAIGKGVYIPGDFIPKDNIVGTAAASLTAGKVAANGAGQADRTAGYYDIGCYQGPVTYDPYIPDPNNPNPTPSAQPDVEFGDPVADDNGVYLYIEKGKSLPAGTRLVVTKATGDVLAALTGATTGLENRLCYDVKLVDADGNPVDYQGPFALALPLGDLNPGSGTFKCFYRQADGTIVELKAEQAGTFVYVRPNGFGGIVLADKIAEGPKSPKNGDTNALVVALVVVIALAGVSAVVTLRRKNQA